MKKPIRNRTTVIFALLFLTFSFFSPVPVEADITFWDDLSAGKLIEELLEDMSDEEICAQVLMVGWSQPEPTPLIMRWIKNRNIGGVKVFGWNGNNIYTLARAIGSMQKTAADTPHSIPLFVATDQEGGLVRHVKGETLMTPGNMAIGATGLPFDAYTTARFIGNELRVMGINMNFAPTVDVYLNPEDRVIGPRAFSQDPVETGKLGVAYYRGLESTGVISTAKHFPGHGNAKGDSHGMLPVIHNSFEELWERDILPYRFLIREGLPAILSGHLNFPEITGNDKPASLSSFFRHDILDKRLGYEGIVITDDMYMNGAQIYADRHQLSFPELCIEALKAGNDMIMLSRTPGYYDDIWEAIYSKYRKEPGFKQIIRDAVRRILRIKLRYLKAEDRVPLQPDLTALEKEIPNPQGKEFFFQQATRSVTLIRDHHIPLDGDKTGKILLAGQDPDFIDEGRAAFPDASSLFFDFAKNGITGEQQRLASIQDNYDTIIFCLADYRSLEVLKVLEDSRANIIVFSILTPVYLSETAWVKSAIAVYGWGIESFQAGYSAIKGDFIPQGRLPISIRDNSKAAGEVGSE